MVADCNHFFLQEVFFYVSRTRTRLRDAGNANECHLTYGPHGSQALTTVESDVRNNGIGAEPELDAEFLPQGRSQFAECLEFLQARVQF